MSEPIRYGLADADLGRIHPKPDGHLVMWSDYAALKAEVERLKDQYNGIIDTQLSAISSLKAEVERLRKAGDAMNEEIRFAWLESSRSNGEQREAWLKRVHQCLKDWLAAKEGRDAK